MCTVDLFSSSRIVNTTQPTQQKWYSQDPDVAVINVHMTQQF